MIENLGLPPDADELLEGFIKDEVPYMTLMLFDTHPISLYKHRLGNKVYIECIEAVLVENTIKVYLTIAVKLYIDFDTPITWGVHEALGDDTNNRFDILLN